MRPSRTALSLALIVSGASVASAQEIPPITPDSLRISEVKLDSVSIPLPGLDLVGVNDIERDLLSKIREVYQLHDKAIEAQMQEDIVAAEEFINAAINTTQRLMDEMPELQANRRFIALYRTVLTEYQEFYGILEPLGDVDGDIFAIRDEMFNSDNDFFASEYLSLPTNLNIARTDVPLIQNSVVNSYMAYYWIRRPDVMERWLERSELYFPMMERIFREEGVPTELIHLSMIESGLVPVATSRAKAVGLWQFMRATGAMYGLKVDSWVDERRDPEKSTRAAARHLKDLYAVWGDWHLALAGYNVSPGRIRSSIRNAGNIKDFWVISPYLPAETRGYVPSYIAATIIAGNREQFGFSRRYNENEGGLQWDTYPVKGSISLDVLARAVNISTDSLKTLNPELLRNATPPGNTPYELKIPKGSRTLFEVAYTEIPSNARVAALTHTVKKGETLGALARRYDTTVRELMETNPGLTAKLQIGQRITIPSNRIEGAAAPAPAVAAANTTTTANASGTTRTHTVRRGDTLGKLAQTYGTTVNQLKQWNNVGNVIRIGQRLIVSRSAPAVASASTSASSNQSAATSGSSAIRYTVKANDNLHNIARIHNVTVDSIKKSNNLSSNMIRPGQVLLIHR